MALVAISAMSMKRIRFMIGYVLFDEFQELLFAGSGKQALEVIQDAFQ